MYDKRITLCRSEEIEIDGNVLFANALVVGSEAAYNDGRVVPDVERLNLNRKWQVCRFNLRVHVAVHVPRDEARLS